MPSWRSATPISNPAAATRHRPRKKKNMDLTYTRENEAFRHEARDWLDAATAPI